MSQKYRDLFLDQMRQAADPLADEVVGQLFANGQIDTVNQLMRDLIYNDDLPPEALPPQVSAYLAASAVLPAWAEPEHILRGEQLFWRYGPSIVLNLLCYGLPSCYCATPGVTVLVLTSRLHSNATRRVTETAQLVVDVMQPGGLASAGRGVRSLQKVRLMHAGVRYQIKHDPHSPVAWDNATRGVPVNQEDLAGTLMAFSWICLDGLRKLGFQVTDEDAEAYLHTWNVVGYLLGLRPELLPANLAEAEELTQTIARRQFAPSDDGRFMAKALIEMMQYHLPGNLLDHFPEAFIRYLLGDSHADILSIGHQPLAEAVLMPLKRLRREADAVVQASSELTQAARTFARLLIGALLLISRGGRRPSFRIPQDLRETWGINWLD